MSGNGIISLLLIIVNVLFSYKGFKDRSFYDKYVFEVEKITLYKDYKRILTSGFLHANWMHLIFNMISLYFFSAGVESYLGSVQYLLIYFASLIAGNLFSLLIHKNDSSYSSVGASGAVCGIIFASIALFPGMKIGLFFFPIPGWIYGLAFVLLSIYGIKSSNRNIGYDAHLGGALTGMLIAILMVPSVLVTNYFPILIICIPSLAFIYIIIRKPHLLFIDDYFFKTSRDRATIDHRYNMEKADRQKEVDMILEKIHKKGIKSLTSKEKQILDEYSKTVR